MGVIYDESGCGSGMGEDPAPSQQSRGTLDVLAERRRQIEVEEFDASHDDMATKGQLATAAACYVIHASHLGSELESFWPWDMSWWKPSGRRHDLVKAAALILAEIDRIDRAVDALTTEGKP
jgi:hypothetical protein